MERPAGWTTITTPDGNTRFWVVATDPREGIPDMSGGPEASTIYVRRGELSSGEIAAAQTIDASVILPERP